MGGGEGGLEALMQSGSERRRSRLGAAGEFADSRSLSTLAPPRFTIWAIILIFCC